MLTVPAVLVRIPGSVSIQNVDSRLRVDRYFQLVVL